MPDCQDLPFQDDSLKPGVGNPQCGQRGSCGAAATHRPITTKPDGYFAPGTIHVSQYAWARVSRPIMQARTTLCQKTKRRIWPSLPVC